MQSQGIEECGHMAYGSSGAEALDAIRMHIEGRHQREIDRRDEEVRRKKMAEQKEERQAINDERIKQLEHEAQVEINKIMRIKEEEKNGEEKIGGMLKNLNENRVERVGDALKVESVLTKEREFPQWGQKQEYESWIQHYEEYKDHLKTRRRIVG